MFLTGKDEDGKLSMRATGIGVPPLSPLPATRPYRRLVAGLDRNPFIGSVQGEARSSGVANNITFPLSYLGNGAIYRGYLYLHGAAPLKQLSNLWNGILGAIEMEGP